MQVSLLVGKLSVRFPSKFPLDFFTDHLPCSLRLSLHLIPLGFASIVSAFSCFVSFSSVCRCLCFIGDGHRHRCLYLLFLARPLALRLLLSGFAMAEPEDPGHSTVLSSPRGEEEEIMMTRALEGLPHWRTSPSRSGDDDWSARQDQHDQDVADAISKRTRAHYSLADMSLDQLETFLQESDEEDYFQNVDDEEEYRKFLAAVQEKVGAQDDNPMVRKYFFVVRIACIWMSFLVEA